MRNDELKTSLDISSCNSSGVISNSRVMAILNCTPDSFSGDGVVPDSNIIRRRVESLFDQGAGVVDIGAVASGPDSRFVSAIEEERRLESVIGSGIFELASPQRIFSIDTYRSKIADLMLTSGARIVNDISSLRYDEDMLGVCAKHACKVVLMFSKEEGVSPQVSNSVRAYQNILDDISTFFEERISFAEKGGIRKMDIILDPGMGAFLGSDPKISWEVVRGAGILRERFSDFSLLYGVSRKGFLCSSEDMKVRDSVSKILELSLLDVGIDFIRTHDVASLHAVARARETLSAL